MNEMRKCPKCSGEMKEGFIADTWGDVGHGTSKQEWGDGSKNWWRQLNTQKKVKSFACESCGYIENFVMKE